MPDEQVAEKIKDFMQEVILFARGGHSRFASSDEIANQALIILSIEQLNIQNNTLDSIKHLLTDSQIDDINKLMKQNEAIKAKLYGSVLPM